MYFSALEKKEDMENKMDSVKRLEVKVVSCSKVFYRHTVTSFFILCRSVVIV